jgi:hypothetical protein
MNISIWGTDLDPGRKVALQFLQLLFRQARIVGQNFPHLHHCVVVHYLITLLPGLFVILLEQVVYEDTFELGETVHRDFALPRLAVFAASDAHAEK